MATCKAVSAKGGVGGIIGYVTGEEKTEEKLVSGIECSPSTAKTEMQATKELWGKTGGRTYKHFIISYAPNEQITPLEAHKNALDIIKGTEVFKGFESILATHTDTEHIHTHIIVNSVSFEDGHKLQWSKQDLVDFKNRVDQQCIEQGLTVCEKGKHFDGSINDDVSTWDKSKHKVLEKAFTGDYKSYLLDVANAVAQVRQQSTSRESFIKLMSEQNIQTEWKDTHKNITFTTAEGKKVRNSNLEKTFKVDFGKDGLENEFQTNERRTREEANSKRTVSRVEQTEQNRVREQSIEAEFDGVHSTIRAVEEGTKRLSGTGREELRAREIEQQQEIERARQLQQEINEQCRREREKAEREQREALKRNRSRDYEIEM